MIAEQYCGICANIEALRTELQEVKKSGISETYEGIIQKKIETLEGMLTDIDTWLSAIEDAEMQAIIRFHFMLGLTWSETNQKVFGYDDGDYSRKRYYRFRKENGLK